ncbi:hypothetical protein [Zunongwangia endophytica]|uniref:Uncharacterized protein n=1 Tax=Zunongwangia endophytica TaxID=1808945 RepID=A0ABV8HDF5_9FLAO|nr:hypothetical protein [Zunongwangia endophytica]MDN3594678.1 hypothetical protein [Zunongwangia endophytica]
MKKSSKTPEEKFNKLLKGSESAKISALILITISAKLIYQMREHIEYLIPMAIGVILLIGYTINNLWLKNYKIDEKNIQFQLKRYKLYLAKREKYEVSIMFIWILTVVPSQLYGKDINLFVLLIFMALTFIFIVIVNFLFKKTKIEVKKLESEINQLKNSAITPIGN